MDAAYRAELLAACHEIFGLAFDPSFLGHLEESGLRSAWRLKALQTHPDRTVDKLAKQRRTQSFIEARRAYVLLRDYLQRRGNPLEPAAAWTRHPPPPAPAPRPPHRPRPHRSTARRRGDPCAAPHLPRRRLRIGEYLYHSRAISFSSLIQAILWQRRQRDRFCEIVRRWGYLSDSGVELLLSRRHPHEQVGATARRLRLLTTFQVRTVLVFQQSRQEPLGRFFIQRGLLTPAALALLLRRFESHNATFTRVR